MPLLTFLFTCAPAALALAIAANVASGVATAGMLFIIQAVLVATTAPGPRTALFFALFVVVSLGMRLVSSYLAFDASHRAILALRSRLASLILRAPLVDIETVKPTVLLGAFTEDVNTVVAAVPGVPVVALNAAIIAGCVAFMIYLSAWLGIVAVVLGGLGAIAYVMLTKRSAAHFGAAEAAFQAMFGYFRALTEGIKELKLNRPRRDAYVSRVFLPSAATYRESMLRGSGLHYVAHIFIYVLILLAMGVILFALPEGRTRTVVTGYALVLLFVGPPIETILLWIPPLLRANVAFAQIERVSSALGDVRAEDDAPGRAAAPGRHTVELRGVTFAYPGGNDGQFTLGPLDVRLTSGEVVFVVGGNGSGKSTLVKLLSGLYRPAAGSIALDGVEVGDGNREWYRQHFSTVFSEVFLFDRLIGFDAPDVDARATRLLADLGLDSIVTVQDGRISTLDLSHGQRKRLALLVALLENRSVYVFDEWAAGQDPRFKHTFYTRVLAELKAAGKIVVAVTHDETYFGVADRVVVLEDGHAVRPSEGHGFRAALGALTVETPARSRPGLVS